MYQSNKIITIGLSSGLLNAKLFRFISKVVNGVTFIVYLIGFHLYVNGVIDDDDEKAKVKAIFMNT